MTTLVDHRLPAHSAAGASAGARATTASNRWLWTLVRRDRMKWAALGALVVILAGSQLVFPYYYSLIFNRVILENDLAFLWVIAAGMAAFFVVRVTLELTQARLNAGAGMRLVNDLRATLFAHLQDLPVDYFGRARTGDLVDRFGGDLAAIERVFTVALYKVALNGLISVVSLFALFFVEWHLALCAVGLMTVGSLVPRLVGKGASGADYERRQGDGNLSAAVQEMIASHRVTRAFGLEASRLGAFRDLLARAYVMGRRSTLLNAYVEKSASMGLFFVRISIVAIGGYFVVRGFLTAGAFMAFYALLFNVGDAINTVVMYVPDLIKGASATRRVGELLGQPTVALAHVGATAVAPLTHEIRFDNVSFGYGERTVLDGVSFTIRAGESVAMVGRSGSGKSTVLSLLLRFYDPRSGAITLDGRDLRSIQPASLRAQIGSVFQSNFLFDTSVRENIRMGRLGAADADVEQAARRASIHDVIVDLPRGYDTPVGEAGGHLSGGQQQRLALARAMLREPPILVLDEATSALDPATEAEVNATLDRVARGRSRIAVTHRLAGAVNADRILVFESGRVIEEGTHVGLLGRRGAYFDLWQKQSTFVVNASGTKADLDALFLRTIPMFADLAPAVLDTLATQFISELHPANHVVVREGDAGDKFYVIVRGRVEVSSTTTAEPFVLEEGDYFGEIALLANTPRIATVRTRDPTLLMALVRTDFERFLTDAPPAVRAEFARVAAQRLAAHQPTGAAVA